MAKSGSRRKPGKIMSLDRARVAAAIDATASEPVAQRVPPGPPELPPAGSLQKLVFLGMLLVVIAWLSFLGWMVLRGSHAAPGPGAAASPATQPAAKS